MSVSSDALPTGMSWETLLTETLTQGGVPSPASESIDTTLAVFQAMYLDLGTIIQKIAASGVAPGIVTIYADVLNVPAGTAALPGTTLMIITRVIQTADTLTITIDYRSDADKNLMLFANEIDGAVSVLAAWTAPDGPAGQTFPVPQAPPLGGVRVVLASDGPAMTDMPYGEATPVFLPDAFVNALSVEFIVASLLYDQQPAIALAMFDFIQDWAAGSDELLGTYLRASSASALLSAQTGAQANGAAFVPYLSQAVYTTLATAFVAQAKQYETDYMALSTQKVVDDNAIALAKTLLANQTYQSDYTQKLLAQSKSNYANAVAAVDAATANFATAKRTVDTVSIDFRDIGVPNWEAKKILDAVIGLVTAAVTFGAGIAGMLVGDEAAGAASAGAAVKGAEAVESAAKAGSEMAALAKRLGDIMKQLKKVVEALNKVYEFTKAVVEAADNIGDAQSQAGKMQAIGDDTGGVDLSDTYQWQIYQLHSDAAMADPVSQGIEYADELKLAIDDVAIYGQALAAAQLASIKAGQDYAAIKLQVELAAQQQQVLQSYVNALVAGEAPAVAMMHQFYQRYIDAKASLFSAAEGYRASFFYWALEASAIKPKIIDPVSSLATGLETLTGIALDQAGALARFSPPPQAMLDKRVAITDAAVIGALKATGTAQWSIGLDAATFAGLDRVRLTQVRVWLEGVNPNDPDGSVTVSMDTAGNYLDRFAGQRYQFTSKPLQRDFQYGVTAKRQNDEDWLFDDGTFGHIEVDGTVDQEVAYAYFQPTPFAEWRITVTVSGSPSALSGLSKITMDFAGSVIFQARTLDAVSGTDVFDSGVVDVA